MRNTRYVTCLLTTVCALVIAVGAVVAQDKEATIRANLAKLPEKDRKLAEAQKWCAVETDDRLGAMGVPEKILIQKQPVFLCCKSCIDQAKKNPDQTLARVKELQAKAKAEEKK
jgi:hypothetical protein